MRALSQTISRGELQEIFLAGISRALKDFALRAEDPESGEVKKGEPGELLRHLTLEEQAAEIRLAVTQMKREWPLQSFRFAGIGSLVQRTLDAGSAPELVGLWDEILVLEDALRGLETSAPGDQNSHFALERTHGSIRLRTQGPSPLSPELENALKRSEEDILFLARTMQLIQEARESGSLSKSPEDRLAIRHAWMLLDSGVRLPAAFCPLGTSGFRPVQTCLSLADPGEGHLKVTARHADLLSGTSVHLEHIDRDGITDRELLEPYRLPAPRHAARVRLHVGTAAPVTVFIGRPVFESRSFDVDLLKSAHLTAAACSAMFALGIAECKIAIERMTASQAILFMKVVKGNVLRDRGLQILSCAFNIHTPIIDDRPDSEACGHTQNPLQVARLGIELALAGGFEKVAWDGASNEVPSRAFIGGPVSFPDLVRIVHQAHSCGIETYISAGMNPSHMGPATCSGVGGVGIGTSLHYSDPDTKLMGGFKLDAIREALAIRDATAASPRGRAARWLAWMDRLHFEGILIHDLVPLRKSLLDAILSAGDNEGNDAKTESLISLIEEISRIAPRQNIHPPGAVEHTYGQSRIMKRARRLLSTKNLKTVGAMTEQGWNERLKVVNDLLENKDEVALANYFDRS